MTLEKKIPNVHNDFQKDDPQKDFLDPATVTVVSTFSWFAIKAAFQGVVGWLAVELFVPVWKKWKNKKEKDESGNQGVSKEES